MQGDRFELFNQMIMSASKTIQRIKVKHMEKYGLASTHTICLRLLYEHPEGLTKKEISDDCDMDKAQVTRIVNELIKNNYVRDDCSERAYNRKFFLTEEGHKITDEINSIVLKVNRFVSGEISGEEISQFYKTFETINHKLREAEEIF